MQSVVNDDAFSGPVIQSQGFAAEYNPFAALASGVWQTGEVANANPGASLLDIIKAVGETYALTRQQRAFLDINQSLVQQGQRPISWQEFGASTAVGVQVDSGTQKTVLVVGLALAGALVLAPMLMRRR